ncbi:hypothetical protein AX774_g1006 [Zancudomyces culisetae]|uniref:Uncharacterized protein n=1 Tax=Zancudomyces culisetae TaxID=1213189 RepID=A0A1R1PWW9_ZANCU|nr:hypothetical protein AX774_g1006 [Zancudomyces culisetae]|eukprot:OMH85439.1 hypothetical protein AX774_g1006 [Zancudomyces culisetae]
MNQTKNIILLVQDFHKLDKLDSTPHCYNINTLLSPTHPETFPFRQICQLGQSPLNTIQQMDLSTNSQ